MHLVVLGQESCLEIWRLMEQLGVQIRRLGEQTAIASSYYSTFTPDRAVNNNTSNDGWISNGSTVGQWIGYHFLLPVTVAEIIWYSTVLFGTASPTAFTLQYSDNGALWTSVKSWSGLTPPSGFTNVTLTLAV